MTTTRGDPIRSSPSKRRPVSETAPPCVVGVPGGRLASVFAETVEF